MRVMVLVKASDESEAGEAGSEELFAAMMRYNEELVKAGVMLAGDGLTPSARGARLVYEGGKRTVVDGPFSETKELVAGYWLWQVGSMDEALEWAKRCPNPDGDDGVIEIRPVAEYEDFADTLPREVWERFENLDKPAGEQ